MLTGILFCLVAPVSADYTFATLVGGRGTSTGINDFGTVVGFYESADGSSHGFLDAGGTFTTIDFSNALETWAMGINNSGNIVGIYVDAAEVQHGFLDAGGTFTLIDFPGALYTQATEINDSGSIVGIYCDAAEVQHGFWAAGGTFTTIDFPGASMTQAYGVNNSGSIVGVYVDQNGKEHGFLYTGGNFTSIDFPGAHMTEAYGVNNFNQIVGQYQDIHGNDNSFLASPSQSVTVSTPTIPTGPSSGISGTAYTYSTGGSTSSLGNPAEYQFDWKGDGTDLSPYGSAAQSQNWTAGGTYSVRARAHDTVNTSVVSNWSSGLSVIISGNTPASNISVTPATYAFGNVKVERAKTASFKVKNVGTADLAISTSITGTDTSMFRIASGGGSKTIKPGRSLSIRVAFKPTSTGSKSSRLEITSNDPITPTVDIPLSGTGQ